ncbi:hypothetical protein [Saccharopolyspora taberi]|uniref:Uncharacterized protein n=1 Tax=Saccharopolyspora taberi TaxID=60895 RepID=A0ABN3VFY3_9PSEU
MRGYSVHLLFHLLAVVAGAAAGVAAGLWWFAGNPTAVWIAGAALTVGIIVLVLEGLYISGVQAPEQPRRSRRRAPPKRSGGTRPDLRPVRPQAAETTVRPPAAAVDGETRKSAADALREWSANNRQ